MLETSKLQTYQLFFDLYDSKIYNYELHFLVIFRTVLYKANKEECTLKTYDPRGTEGRMAICPDESYLYYRDKGGIHSSMTIPSFFILDIKQCIILRADYHGKNIISIIQHFLN